MDTSLWNAPRGYFNTALRGIPPRASIEAARRTLDLWSRGELDWVPWLDELDHVRRAFATLVGVSPAQVGIGHTTAALVNVVAAEPEIRLAGSRPGIRAQFQHDTVRGPGTSWHYCRHGSLV